MSLTEIQPDLYPLEARRNPILLLYENRNFLPPCLYINYQTQVKDAQMNVWIFRSTSVQAKGIALAYSQCMWEKNQALCLCSSISANFVSEPSREEVDILKIIPVGIFMLACEGSTFGTMSKLLCHWISRIAFKFVPELVREALTNSRSDTFDVSFAVKLLSTSRAFCDGHHQSSPQGHLLTLSSAIIYWLALW